MSVLNQNYKYDFINNLLFFYAFLFLQINVITINGPIKDFILKFLSFPLQDFYSTITIQQFSFEVP